jgi:hypothetical protein
MVNNLLAEKEIFLRDRSLFSQKKTTASRQWSSAIKKTERQLLLFLALAPSFFRFR